MERILAYQTTYRKFFTMRRYSARRNDWGEIITCLPGSAAKKVADMGTLDIKSGILQINPKLRKLLKKQEVWVDYNKKIFKDSYKKSSSKTKNQA